MDERQTPADAEYLTPAELAVRWKCDESYIKRLLNQKLPAQVIPKYIDPAFVIPIKGKRILFSMSAHWPPVLDKKKARLAA